MYQTNEKQLAYSTASPLLHTQKVMALNQSVSGLHIFIITTFPTAPEGSIDPEQLRLLRCCMATVAWPGNLAS